MYNEIPQHWKTTHPMFYILLNYKSLLTVLKTGPHFEKKLNEAKAKAVEAEAVAE